MDMTEEWCAQSLAEPARLLGDAYREAQIRFRTEVSQDTRKFGLVESQNCCEEVRDLALEAMNRYNSSRSCSKIKARLHSFAQKVTFYGGVLDVLVQHHPEFVSLAWGATKLLFTSFMNHEKTISKLAEGLSLIAECLPRVELFATLYATPRMQNAICELNVHIIRFLVRAYDWYKERPWEHILHSFTRPQELRYNDLLDAIRLNTKNVQELASCGEQVKVHTIQKEVDEIYRSQMRLETNVSLITKSLALTNSKLDDLQFSNIMDSISVVGIPVPDKITHYFQFLDRRARSSRNPANTLSWRFTSSPRLRQWDECNSSAIMLVRGSFRCRQPLRAFCWELVQQLRAARVSILFALKTPPHENPDAPVLVSGADVLKYLIRQALQITQTLQTESSMALTCTRLQTATDEAGLFQILEAVLSGIPGSVYVLVDLELLSRGHDASTNGGFSWLRAFMGYFERLAQRQPAHRVKVMLLSYSADFPFSVSSQETADFVLRAESTVTAGQGRRGRKRGVRDAKQRSGFKIRGNTRIDV